MMMVMDDLMQVMNIVVIVYWRVLLVEVYVDFGLSLFFVMYLDFVLVDLV